MRFELEVKRGGDERMEGEERGEEGKERMGEERGVRRRKGEGRGNEREGRRIGVKEGKELHGKGSVRGEQIDFCNSSNRCSSSSLQCAIPCHPSPDALHPLLLSLFLSGRDDGGTMKAVPAVSASQAAVLVAVRMACSECCADSSPRSLHAGSGAPDAFYSIFTFTLFNRCLVVVCCRWSEQTVHWETNHAEVPVQMHSLGPCDPLILPVVGWYPSTNLRLFNLALIML